MKEDVLNQLDVVMAIADHGSLTRAAEHLCLTQPAVSYRLAKIEEALNTTLFYRKGRSMSLTSAGKRVLASARVIESELYELKKDIRALSGETMGGLRISSHCYTSYQWLPHVVARMRSKFPRFDVSLNIDATKDPQKALDRGEIDLALSAYPENFPGYCQYPLMDDELFCVVPHDHNLADRKFIHPKNLADENIIVFSDQGSPIVDEFLTPAGIVPNAVLQVPLTEGILALIKSGAGVSALAGWVLSGQDTAGVSAIRMGRSGFTRRWHAIYAKSLESDLLNSFLSEFRLSVAPVTA